MVKKIAISLDEKVFNTLEKERNKNYGINRSRMIEVILAKYFKIKLDNIEKKKKWWEKFL